MTLDVDPSRAGPPADPDALKVRWWMEMLKPTTATVLARYRHPSWPADAAITRNRYGKGEVTYVGSMPSDTLIEELLADAARRAEVPVGTTRFPLIVRGGTLKNGHRVRYVLNYSAQPATFALEVARGTELITGRKLGSGDAVSLSPWGVAIVEED